MVARFRKAPMGHRACWHSFEGSEVLLCHRCGAWAERALKNLAKPCPGRAEKGTPGAKVIAKVLDGKHPMALAATCASATDRPIMATAAPSTAQAKLAELRRRVMAKQAATC